MQARGQAVEALWRAAAPAGSLLRVSMHAGVPPWVPPAFRVYGPQHHLRSASLGGFKWQRCN